MAELSDLAMSCRHAAHVLQETQLMRKITAVLVFALLAPSAGFCADNEADDAKESTGASQAIITKYLQATQSHEDVLRGVSMQVNINASVPKLKEHATLKALRKISKVGQITYRVLGFQGDNTLKSQVIARYLQAEQQGQGDQSLAISPANYKFKYKGERQNLFVFGLTPRKKKMGLFKGEMWLDASTYLPVLEKGRLVKNPSVFFKTVDFERDFAIKDGVAIPEHMTSTIDTRLIGKVELIIEYSNFEPNASDDEEVKEQSVALAGPNAN